MTIILRIVCTALILLASAASGQARFSVQHPPRVAVLNFIDTNAEAQSARYGSSVQSMLVTFLRGHSQFVVDEREYLKPLLSEKQRMQRGMVHVDPDDPAVLELLEKVDVLIYGNVTLFNLPNDQQGPRIEIDAKLLSRFDGRITTAEPRSGPVGCLRSVVDRLGVALEQGFLSSSYGRLHFQLSEPENVGIFLTPIRLDSERHEEKPPVEVGTSIKLGVDRDQIEPWITDPTTYTIENLLSGWYVLSLKRPGYEELGADVARWVARDRLGNVEVYDRIAGRSLANADPDVQRFVVYVEPSRTTEIDGDARNFVLRKQGGSLEPRVKRQYFDNDYSRSPQRVMLTGGKDLALNQPIELTEFAEDQQCGLFAPAPLAPTEHPRTYFPVGQEFDFDKFLGGELIIEDYQGEDVPVGEYQLTVWERNYALKKKVAATVRDREVGVIRIPLRRETLPLQVEITEPLPRFRVTLKGRDTHHVEVLRLDFVGTKIKRGLPADHYTVTTNIPGLEGWKDSIELFSASAPPTYYTLSPPYEPELSHALADDKKPAAKLTIKTDLTSRGGAQRRRLERKLAW